MASNDHLGSVNEWGLDEFNEINRCSVIYGCLVTRISGLKESLDTDLSNCLGFSRNTLLSLTAICQLAVLELSQGKGRKMKPEVTQRDWLKPTKQHWAIRPRVAAPS